MEAIITLRGLTEGLILQPNLRIWIRDKNYLVYSCSAPNKDIVQKLEELGIMDCPIKDFSLGYTDSDTPYLFNIYV